MKRKEMTFIEMEGLKNILKQLFPKDKFFYCDDMLQSEMACNEREEKRYRMVGDDMIPATLSAALIEEDGRGYVLYDAEDGVTIYKYRILEIGGEYGLHYSGKWGE